MPRYTLTFLVGEGAVCLAMKKRGFGAGYWNGFGGKVEAGETTRAAAVREVFEEGGVQVQESDLRQVAQLTFCFHDGACICVDVFFARTWHGEPTETEEMCPDWFAFVDIPYDAMWEDDRYWLPRVLAGEHLTGTVWFDESGIQIADMKWRSATF